MHAFDFLMDQYQRIVFFDVETTGLDFKKDSVIELACISVQRPNTTLEFNWLIKHREPLPAIITKMTNITDELLRTKGVSRTEVVDSLLNDVLNGGRILLAAHNGNFDLNFLRAMIAKEGRSLNWDDVDAIDTLTILKDRKPYPHKLSDAIREYCLVDSVKNTHRAIDDARATMMVFEKMCEENADVAEYINLFGYNPKYGIRATNVLPGIRYVKQPYDSTIKLYQFGGGVEKHAKKT